MQADSTTVVLFEDECSLSNTATVSYSWAAKGKQPVVEQKQRTRERLTLFGAVNYGSGQVTVKTAVKGNANSFKAFLRKVLHSYKDTKIIMVLDNVRYHHAKALRAFLTKHQHRLELVFLPPYSPQFNPMERVWWYMRKKITHNRAVESMKIRKQKFWQLFSHFQQPNDLIFNLCTVSF